MIYSPFNQNNFQGFETYNSQVLLGTGVSNQFSDIQSNSSNRIISKSLAAVCNDKSEHQIKEHIFYAIESNILMGQPVTDIIDSPIYIPKYNSQNDPSIYISIGDVSDNVISQHSIYNYAPPKYTNLSGSSTGDNNFEAENYLRLNPYKDILLDPYRRHKKQNRKDILELHEAYAEFKEFEKQKVNCVKCGNGVSKNKSFIYSGNFVCCSCASNIQSNYLQDWIPRETKSFTGTTRKCDNCKRRRPTSQFVYKTFSGDLDYNSLCRFCLLKKETCSHQASFRKRYYNLYKYKKNDYFDNINAIIENNEDDDDDNNNNNNNDDDEEYVLENDKFVNRNKLISKNAKPLSPQMIQSHPPREEKIAIPNIKKRGRKRKNVEILLQQNKELEESNKKIHLTRTTEINNNTRNNKSNSYINNTEKYNYGSNKNNNTNINNANNHNINRSSFTGPTFITDDNNINHSNINININVNNNNNKAFSKNSNSSSSYRFTNRISNSYYNTFLSADVNIPKPRPPIMPAVTHSEDPIVKPVTPIYDDINEKLKELLESKRYHNKPQIVKLEYEDRIVVSDIGSIPLNIEQALRVYQSNSNMRVRCSVCNKSVLKDSCIVDSGKCFVCNICMKNDEDKSDWSVLENSRSVNDILCISCRMRKTVDQYLKLDEDNVICIQSICRHCFLTKGEELKNNR